MTASPPVKNWALKSFVVYNNTSSVVLQPSEVLNLAGDTDSRSVLDAFFLGKALAEALSERIESSVGEFLSTVGRLQAEQQKQEDVLERAKRAKEKAALEAIEARGLVSKATAENTTPATDVVNSVTSPWVTSEIAPATPSVQSDPDAAEEEPIA
ncbi:hypothetical protein CJ030_MR0G006657 [Morella rubra]|uniref:Uncharacterized protein n=1 Tax=Morella rubra TaxID=262757 RepID=A0A6A1UK98_9ROSI|nr:hypothetical protein CJ030_MR0G006657 [Morella rubra]